MSEQQPLEASAPWVQLTVTDDDWDAAEPALLVTMFSQLALIRAFEENVLELAGAGPDPRAGALQHRAGGRRGRLGPGPDRRRHGERLAPRPSPVPGQDAEPCGARAAWTRPGPIPTRSATCCCAAWPRSAAWTAASAMAAAGPCTSSGARPARIGTNAIVGGGVPLAAGSAWAHKQAGTDAVAVTYFGDGAGEHRLHAGDVQPGRGLAAAAVLLHREQPVRGVDHGAGGHGRAPAVRARPGLRHPRAGGSTA